jgi:hypothetical protein
LKFSNYQVVSQNLFTIYILVDDSLYVFGRWWGGLFLNGINRKYCCGFWCGCGALTIGAATDAASATAATTIIVTTIVTAVATAAAAAVIIIIIAAPAAILLMLLSPTLLLPQQLPLLPQPLPITTTGHNCHFFCHNRRHHRHCH